MRQVEAKIKGRVRASTKSYFYLIKKVRRIMSQFFFIQNQSIDVECTHRPQLLVVLSPYNQEIFIYNWLFGLFKKIVPAKLSLF